MLSDLTPKARRGRAVMHEVNEVDFVVYDGDLG